MAENEDKSSKTEKPTAHKLREAKRKGQVFKSKDIVDNIIILVTVSSIYLLTTFIYNEFYILLRKIINKDMFVVSNRNLISAFQISMLSLMKMLLPILLIALILAVTLNIIQVGFVFSTENIKLDFSKLNPVQGFKRMFSKRSLLELFKFLVKVTVIIFILGTDVKNTLPKTNTVIFYKLNTSFALTFKFLFSKIIKVILILFVFSFVDYYFQKRMYMSDMRMTKKEIKDEMKKLEGDPTLKGKIKDRHRKISTNSLIAATKDATMLIANPTHIAVCIKFEFGMAAPMVVAMARDNIAQKLKEVAKEYDVPIIENKPLARSLFNEAEIGKPVPQEFWEPIAYIIHSIMTVPDTYK